MAAEYHAFQDERFDAKKWINDALRGTASSKPAELEPQVNQLQMQLQLFSTSVNGTFEDQVMQSLARFPTCMITIDKMSREVAHLTQSLAALLTPEALERQAQAERAVRALSELHETRSKLEVCQQTLSKTVYLRDNAHLIDSAFEKGKTDDAAAEIARMQQALGAIKGFEHHDRLAADIAKHEARLQSMVERECIEDLLAQQTQRAQQHLSTLRKIGRADEVLALYTRRAAEPLVSRWEAGLGAAPEGDDGGGFLSFLPAWYSELDGHLAECKPYYQRVFGADADAALVRLLCAVLGCVAESHRQRLRHLPVPALVSAYQLTRELRQRCCAELLHSPTAAAIEQVAAAAADPYEALQERGEYTGMERRHLDAVIARSRFAAAVSDAATLTISPSLVTSVGDCGNELLLECHGAVTRCAQFTGGAAFPALTAALNDVVADFARQVAGLVAQLRGALGLGEAQGEAPREGPFAAEDPVKVKLGLQLHGTSVAVRRRLLLFEQEAKARMRECLAASPGSPGRDRQAIGSPRLSGFAADFLESVSPAPLLGGAADELAALDKRAEALVFDVLLDAVDARLCPLPTLPVWGLAADDGGVPTGTPAPSEYIRLVGDYMLGLPDALTQGQYHDDADDQGGVPGGSPAVHDQHYWMDAVLKRTVDRFINGVLSVPALSASGTEQLAADAEYLDNVLDAFVDGGAPVLKVVEQLCSADAAAYAALLAQVRDVAPADPRAERLFRAVGKKRGADLPPAGDDI